MILSKIPTNKNKKVLIECDFKISSKCKGIYEKVYKNVLNTRGFTNGKDRCIFCFNSLTKCGENNQNFKYKKIENYFENIDSEIKAYLLGWVAGDGGIKKTGLYLSVHKKDKEITDLFCNEISPDFKPFFREYDNTLNIKINSIQIVKDLCKQLNVSPGKKSHKITLPNLEEKLLIHFIRGLFDSDGSVVSVGKKKTRPECNYSSMSEKIKEQIYNFCIEKNINCKISKTMVHWWGIHANNFMDLIYKNANYYLKRKYDLYREWATWIPHIGTQNFPNKKKLRDKSTYNFSGLPWYKKKFGVKKENDA